MVRIRFRRVGSRHQPSYRIVAADKESPRDGRFLEALGHYNPRTEPATVEVNEARLFHWMMNGAQPSDSVKQTLKSLGTWERWERYKAGESLENLLEEAKTALVEVDPRTRRDDLALGRALEGKAEVEDAVPAEEEAAAAEKLPAEPEPETAEEPTDQTEGEGQVPEASPAEGEEMDAEASAGEG